RSVQPSGPYLIGGWSFGGVVAFEMARQILELGERVALLALVDSHAPTGDPPRSPDDLASLAAFGRSLGIAWEQLSLDLDHLRRLEGQDRLAYLLGQARASSAVTPDLDLARAERWLRVFEHHIELLQRYRPLPHPGPAVLFRATE